MGSQKNRTKSKGKGGQTPEPTKEERSQNCDMLPWRFRVHVRSDGVSDVQDDIDRLDDRTAERFKAIVRHLADEPRDQWHRPQAAKLSHYVDLYELRFNKGNTPCRPTGYFELNESAFVITLFVTKNRNGYHPQGAFDIANSRRTDIRTGKAGASPLQVHGENFPPVQE